MTMPYRPVLALALGLTLAACGEEEADKAAAAPAKDTIEVAGQAPAPQAEPNPLYVEAAAGGEAGPLLGDAPLGDADAPVTVIEYASLTCGHCAAFHTDTYPGFKEKYVDTGKVRMIFRDFPLDQMALAAAMIARCDGAPEKYHAFVDLFLRQQKKWTRAEDVMGELRRMARLGGLTDDAVKACLSNETLGQSVLDRAREAQDSHGISSTPSFIINGELHSGALPLPRISAIIDPLLE